MSADIALIKTKFLEIKSKGFIKCLRPNNKDGGIGNTFEDCLGVKENNKKHPDYEGFEVKSQRSLTSSYVSLFSKSPTFPPKANKYLKDTFGRGDSHFPELKSLHSSIFGHQWNTLYDTYQLILKVDNINQRLYLLVKDNLGLIVSDNVIWSFEDLNKAAQKLSSLIVVIAEIKNVNEEIFYHFNKATVYHNFVFNNFLNAIQNGDIMFDIRIGVYKTGKNIGKPHDHGSGFRVKRENVFKLYEETLEIE